MNYIGCHLSISKGLKKSIEKIKKLNGNAIQFFLKSPRSNKFKCKLTDEDCIEIKRLLKENDIFAVCHGSYLINLAKNPVENDYAIQSLIDDMIITSKLGGLGVVVHQGKQCKNPNLDECYRNYADSVVQIIKKSPKDVKLILETAAGQGTEMCTKIEELAKMYNMIPDEYKENIGFCIDTCHIFSAGYDLTSKTKINNYFDNFDYEIGIDKICLIHLNDSKKGLNCCVDRHESIGLGYIFKNNLEAFHYFCKYVLEIFIPIILETPNQYLYGEEIRLIKQSI